MKAPHPTFRISYEDGTTPAAEFCQEYVLIGSDADDCDIKLDKQSTVSPVHAAVRWRGGRFYLTDVDEANDTWLNYKDRLLMFNDEEALANGDVAQIGPYLFEFGQEADEPELTIRVTRLILSSAFVIKRTDQPGEKRVEGEALSVGSDRDCHLWLNHLNVSPLHAGINRIADRFDPTRSCFHLTDLTVSNSTLLDDRLLITYVPAPIGNGSLAQIGPYLLKFGVEGATLNITAELTPTSNTGTAEKERDEAAPPASATDPPADTRGETAEAAQAAPASRAGEGPVTMADALKIFWAKRTRAKAARASPLHPKPVERSGRARFAWRPTSDLASPRSFAIAFWVLLVVGLCVRHAARSDSVAFEPRPLSAAHARAATSRPRPVARDPVAYACAACHTDKARMNEACASCHQSESFAATVTPPHRAAGIGCTDCHAEHKGVNFRPGLQPLSVDFQPGVETEGTCVGCHNDANRKTYNGKTVYTPHGGTFGYPLVGGRWKWRGLSQEEWEAKPAAMRDQLARMEQAAQRWPVAGDAAERRRSAEFHMLHIYRVKATGGIKGDEEGLLTCSSCHNNFTPVDRATPRTTCATCHNGCVDAQTGRTMIAADRPNCASCHVQHVHGVGMPCGVAGSLLSSVSPGEL